MTSKPWRVFRGLAEAALLGIALLGAAAAPAAEPESCRRVRLADVGWTDVTTTTALVSRVLKDLGYQPQVTLLSVPVTFASMKNGDVDVFLGNWMPAQLADRRPYLEDHSVEVVRANLEGAKYTLAVPAYAFDAGLENFADIHRFGKALNHSIYGIESGNDGNRHVLGLIQHNDFGLGDFRLVESSEQGMLAEVARAYAARTPIVFLAWDPHPMNMHFALRYLAGGDASFGPNYGGAAVYTLVRAHYLSTCPNVGRLLANVSVSPRGESEVMSAIIDRQQPPESAAGEWLAAHPEVRAAWTAGVAPLREVGGGAPAAGRREPGALERWMTAHKLPIGASVATAIERLKQHRGAGFDRATAFAAGAIGGVNQALHALPSPLLILAAALTAWLLNRSLALAAFVALALMFIINQGYWSQTLETLALVLVSALTATVLGVPLGIAAAHRPRLYAFLRPALDLMQTLPTFVYLIPTLVLFGLGVVPALISTVIFALPAPVRMTHLGIRSVPTPLLEAGQAFGATGLQLLLKVELPSAAPLILAGLTQCIMLSLSMVVIAALVGAGGLGVPVVRALNTVQVGMGFEAGLAIVVLAIVLDRLTRFGRRSGRS